MFGLGKEDESWYETNFCERVMGSPERGWRFQDNFKEGNLNNIDTFREKSRYKAPDLSVLKREPPAIFYILLILLP